MSTNLIDTRGRVIDYLRISLTDLCNLRCRYCMPVCGIPKVDHSDLLRFEDIETIVRVAAKEGIKKIRITGGEPLIKRGIVDLIKMISSISGITDIGMTTNGILLEEYAEELKEAGLNRINISLDSLNPKKYSEMTRGGDLSRVLKGIEVSKKIGFSPIKINTVLIGGFNEDETDSFIKYSHVNGLKWRLIELMPIGEVAGWSKDKFVNGTKLLEKHPHLVPDTKCASGIGKNYKHREFNTTIKLIDPLSNSFCKSCNRIRLTADGKVKPCLHSDKEYDIKPYLGNEKKLREFYRFVVFNKPLEHNILDNNYKPIDRNMNRIGG